MKHVVIGCVGHVDHGKTWLTRALTGTDTDRLKEERERGITIDIGFAQLVLPNGQRASIIDVPGHEGLVRNMIAGATGMDLIMLVVAADEGFMPQTQEHMEILDLLGVERGVVALTKCDSVSEEWIEMAEADLADHLRGTFLEHAPVVRVSAATGQGIDELKGVLAALVEHAATRNADRAARLPVDRSFTVRGFGTVVTGTLVDGTVRVGDELEMYPTGGRTRVRGLQNHGEPSDEMQAGMRVAANLAGVEHAEVGRGHTLAAPGTVSVTTCATGLLRLTGDSPFSVRNGSRLHFFEGTQELVCRVRLLDADELAPGERGFAQFQFERPLAARGQDRFIVRFYSPVVTVGGGTILDVVSSRARRHDEAVVARLRALAGSPAERAAQRIRDAGDAPLPVRDLALADNLSPRELDEALGALDAAGEVVRVGDAVLAAGARDRLYARALSLLERRRRDHPLERGVHLREFTDQAFPGCGSYAADLLRDLEQAGIVERRGKTVCLAGFDAAYTPELARIRDAIARFYRDAGFEARTADEARAAVAGDADDVAEVLSRMMADGEVVTLAGGATMGGEQYRDARERFVGLFGDKDRVAIAEFRDALGISRKYAQLLLDAFDAEQLSRLEDGYRVLLSRRRR